jgi:hypothetical protein
MDTSPYRDKKKFNPSVFVRFRAASYISLQESTTTEQDYNDEEKHL